VSGPGFIREEPPGRCSICDQIEELRPYGPGGKPVCFRCAMQDEEVAAFHYFVKVLAYTEDQARAAVKRAVELGMIKTKASLN
jgi:hypothetical protein